MSTHGTSTSFFHLIIYPSLPCVKYDFLSPSALIHGLLHQALPQGHNPLWCFVADVPVTLSLWSITTKHVTLSQHVAYQLSLPGMPRFSIPAQKIDLRNPSSVLPLKSRFSTYECFISGGSCLGQSPPFRFLPQGQNRGFRRFCCGGQMCLLHKLTHPPAPTHPVLHDSSLPSTLNF